MFNEISAGNVAYLGVDFTDKHGNPSTPTAVWVTVTSKRPDAVIRPETQLLVGIGSSTELVITSIENTFVNPNSKTEIRHVGVRAQYGSANDEFNTSYEYRIRSDA